MRVVTSSNTQVAATTLSLLAFAAQPYYSNWAYAPPQERGDGLRRRRSGGRPQKKALGSKKRRQRRRDSRMTGGPVMELGKVKIGVKKEVVAKPTEPLWSEEFMRLRQPCVVPGVNAGQASSRVLERFVKALEKNATNLPERKKGVAALALYAGSFAKANEHTATAVVDMMSRTDELKKLKFTKEVCDQAERLFLEHVVAELTPEEQEAIQEFKPGDIGKIMPTGNGNVFPALLSLTRSLKDIITSQSVRGGVTAVSTNTEANEERDPGKMNPVVEKAANCIQSRVESSRHSQRSENTQRSVTETIKEISDQLAKVNVGVLSVKVLPLLQKQTFFKQLTILDECEEGLAAIVRACDRAATRLGMLTSDCDGAYMKVDKKHIQAWLYWMRWQQFSWASKTFNIKTLEAVNCRNMQNVLGKFYNKADVAGRATWLQPLEQVSLSTWKTQESTATIHRSYPSVPLLADVSPKTAERAWQPEEENSSSRHPFDDDDEDDFDDGGFFSFF